MQDTVVTQICKTGRRK